VVAAVVGLWLAGSVAVAAPAFSSSAGAGFAQLHGSLRLTPGRCAGGRPTGSYLSVTYGTRAIRNPASGCAGGAITLLRQGRGSLSTEGFSPASDLRFDGHGDATASTIARPVRFGRHDLGVVTAARNLQDAAAGASIFTPPHIYVSGRRAYADVRAVQVLYGGEPGSSCASASGYGCWLVGAERATGSYDPRTHRLSLSWFTGESFVPTSAGTAVHLSGVFTGTVRAVPRGSTVDLGTSSLAAGSPHTAAVVADTAGAQAAAGSHSTGRIGSLRSHSQHRRHRRRHARDAAAAGSVLPGSSTTQLIAGILVLSNLIGFVSVARRRARA
jgi:hypothetical protein